MNPSSFTPDDSMLCLLCDFTLFTRLANYVFELLLGVWTASRDLKETPGFKPGSAKQVKGFLHVRISSVDALGQMVGLITRTQLKAALPRLMATILELYKRDQDISFLATCSLHNLYASVLPNIGPPLLDFEELTIL